MVVDGSVGGNPVDLRDEVMPYCPNRVNLTCSIRCKVGFPTPYSPRYAINDGCYSSGRMGKDLQPIVINATHNGPSYTIYFFCHVIDTYRCVINETVHSQEVRVEPGNALQQYGIYCTHK